MIGIARAFLCAGARAALASLWQVKDDATNKFMTSFYQHLLAFTLLFGQTNRSVQNRNIHIVQHDQIKGN